MSLFDYQQSKEIAKSDPPFAALIMAAMRKADSTNFAILCYAFPEIAVEAKLRYDAPGGLLHDEATQ